jgi:hypothetical protein
MVLDANRGYSEMEEEFRKCEPNIFSAAVQKT